MLVCHPSSVWTPDGARLIHRGPTKTVDCPRPYSQLATYRHLNHCRLCYLHVASVLSAVIMRSSHKTTLGQCLNGTTENQ